MQQRDFWNVNLSDPQVLESVARWFVHHLPLWKLQVYNPLEVFKSILPTAQYNAAALAAASRAVVRPLIEANTNDIRNPRINLPPFWRRNRP